MIRNHVQLIGNIKDIPVINKTPQLTVIVQIEILVNEESNNTDWFKLIAYGEVARRINEETTKGTKIQVYGVLDHLIIENVSEIVIIIGGFIVINQ